MIRSQHAATIEIIADGSAYSLRITASDGVEWPPLQARGSVGTLRTVRASLLGALDTFKGAMRALCEDTGYVGDIAGATAALAALDTASLAFVQGLIRPNDPELTISLLDFLDRSIASVEALGLVPEVVLACPAEHVFPSEVLLTTAAEPSASDGSVAGLDLLAHRFLGFRACTRTMLGGVEGRAAAAPTGAGMTVARNATLDGSAREIDELRSLGLVVLEPLLPEDGTDERGMLATLSYDLLGGVAEGGRAPADVIHLSCHCEPDGEEGAKLHFASAPDMMATRVRIGAQALTEHLATQRRTRHANGTSAAGAPPRLVFANACSTTNPQPEAIAHFPIVFLEDARTATFIGPMVDIHDGVAATFAPYVYRHLVGPDAAPVGVAVRRARTDLLHDLNNPIALVYTVYGSTDTTLAPAT